MPTAIQRMTGVASEASQMRIKTHHVQSGNDRVPQTGILQ
jgi:hypothetical protein